MKKVKQLALATLMAFAIFGCQASQTKEQQMASEPSDESLYTCPMNCEGEKQYSEAGTCPVCKMDLEMLADANAHPEH